MAGLTIPYAEVTAIKAFLSYLNVHWSKSINPNDNLLIAAVGAWITQESGGLQNVIGNNPFNMRSSPLQSGTRLSRNGNGHFALFATMSIGFEAAAYQLIHGNKAYGYQLAINALKNGGNQGATDFLAALAMSSWDAGHYGTTDWPSAYDPKRNHLLRVYHSITGLQIANPHPHAPPPKPKPVVFGVGATGGTMAYYNAVARSYIDPWAARDAYRRRHRRMDGMTTKR